MQKGFPLILIVLISAGGYFLYQQQTKSTIVTPLDQTTTQPSPTSDETVNYMTYKLSNFSISLPNTWSLSKNTTRNESYSFSSGLPGRSELLIEKTPYKTAEEVKSNIYGWSGKQPKIQQLTLGTASATEYYDCIGIEGCTNMYILIINDAGIFYKMQFTPYPDQPSGLYQQILSTFKFTKDI